MRGEAGGAVMLMLMQWMPAENKGTKSNEQMRITMPIHEPACGACRGRGQLCWLSADR